MLVEEREAEACQAISKQTLLGKVSGVPCLAAYLTAACFLVARLRLFGPRLDIINQDMCQALRKHRGRAGSLLLWSRQGAPAFGCQADASVERSLPVGRQQTSLPEGSNHQRHNAEQIISSVKSADAFSTSKEIVGGLSRSGTVSKRKNS